VLDVAIIGAGPFGLSLAAHLAQAGVSFQLFGRPMASWRHFMPPGMFLKSHAWSSSLSDPQGKYTVETFFKERGLPYRHALGTLPLETFADYGKAFQQRFAPDVREKWLSLLERCNGGYRATFDDGEVVMARRVVLAIGVHPFKFVPEPLEGLPGEVLSHSADHGPLDAFDGKRVVILGAGASASGLAGLLAARGVAVSLVARGERIQFAQPARANSSRLRQALRPLKALASPGSGIGTGWLLKTWSEAPWVFHALPEALRLGILRTTLGPSGHFAMRERVVGKVPMLLGRSLKSAAVAKGMARLTFASPGAPAETVEADHVIAATGFKVDIDRLAFLHPELRSMVRTANGYPALSPDYETTAAGLYFIGPASAGSFGPVVRFVCGAVHPARRLAKALRAPAAREARPSPAVSGEKAVAAR